MFEKLILNNFRCYKNGEFEFHPGINIFTGSSNKGKSTIFRALYWLINNRPLGNSVVSYWNRDEEGNPIDPVSVQLFMDNNLIERKRDDTDNCYIINNKKLEAFKFNVPEEIKEILNVSDINIQEQGEQSFLISFSPGETAKYFNKAIGLDIIDNCLSLVKRKRKECESSIQNESIEIDKLKLELKKINWIDSADLIMKKIECLKKKRENKENIFYKLEKDVEKYYDIDKKLNKLSDVDKLDLCLNELENIKNEINILDDKLFSLQETIEDYNELELHLKKLENVDNYEKIINEIILIRNNILENIKKLKDLSNKKDKLEETEIRLSLVNEELRDKLEKMPDTCPLCGNNLERNTL